MRYPAAPNPALSRYLTPFFRFALGLALVVAFASCSRKASETPESSTATAPPVSTFTAIPTQASAPQQNTTTPTPLPAVPATPDERTPSPLGVTSGELRGLTVNLWHPWTGAQEAALNAIVDQFNRTNRWGIGVQASGYEGFGRLDEAMEAGLTSGDLPDVVIDYGYQVRHWDDSDAVIDLTAYVNDPTWGFSSEEQANFYPGFWSEDVIASGGEKIRLGVPYYRSAYVLFYNQSWAQELGYPNPPVTPEDFRVQACAGAEAVTRSGDKSNPGKGGWLITTQPGALMGWIYAFGGQITNPDGSGYEFNTPQTRQALEYLKELSDHNCAWSGAVQDPATEFASRKALFLVGSLFDIPAQRRAFTQAGSPDEWSVIPFPSRKQPVVVAYGPSLAITHSTPAKQLAAWLVVEWLVYPPNQAKWVETLETFPTRQNTLGYLNKASSTDTQWKQSLALLPVARSEPSLASWSILRWTLQDAMAQLTSSKFQADQIPALLKNLDELASEVLSRVH